MSDYDLSLTGAQIDAALTKVHNADTTPVNGSTNMVTSNGVHDAVNDIQFANLNSNLVSTDLSTGNNNITIPTTQAVVNHVNTNSYIAANNIAYFTAADGSRTSDGNIGGWTEVSDPGNFCSINGSLIEIAGNSICTVIFNGGIRTGTGNTPSWDYVYQLYDAATSSAITEGINTTRGDVKKIGSGNGYFHTNVGGFNKIGDSTPMFAGIYLDRANSTAYYANVKITVIRHL